MALACRLNELAASTLMALVVASCASCQTRVCIRTPIHRHTQPAVCNPKLAHAGHVGEGCVQSCCRTRGDGHGVRAAIKGVATHASKFQQGSSRRALRRLARGSRAGQEHGDRVRVRGRAPSDGRYNRQTNLAHRCVHGTHRYVVDHLVSYPLTFFLRPRALRRTRSPTA
jgi:hypothetical protein